jgi:hypothetical protein
VTAILTVLGARLHSLVSWNSSIQVLLHHSFAQIKSTPPELFGEHAFYLRNPEDCRTWVGAPPVRLPVRGSRQYSEHTWLLGGERVDQWG